MTSDEKLAEIRQAVQVDPGQRGLAKDPHDNLFNACGDDLAAACLSIALHPDPRVWLITGFQIPTATPPRWETDGPLGVVFLLRACQELGIPAVVPSPSGRVYEELPDPRTMLIPAQEGWPTHVISIERVGPGQDGRCRTMRGRDITDNMTDVTPLFTRTTPGWPHWVTIGIGDGGNEIGMGKIPHETVCRNIPNGELIHCRVATDQLIVAGVSNWGAYALAAGLFVLKHATPSEALFDPDGEQQILQKLVVEGNLVDGVTGLATATVDGLRWAEYIQPLRRLRELLRED